MNIIKYTGFNHFLGYFLTMVNERQYIYIFLKLMINFMQTSYNGYQNIVSKQ